jgi:pimeloyl-ACP methyl ester carboxylesterase
MGVSEGGPMTILFATTYPERTAAAILYGSGPSYRRAVDYPWAPDREEHMAAAAERERRWGDQDYFDALLDAFAPSIAADPEVRKWWARYARMSASPWERFLGGIWSRGEWDLVETDRMLATVLFTESSIRRRGPSSWATRAGGSCSSSITRSFAGSSSAITAGNSTLWATASSRPSTGPHGRFAALPPLRPE